jgi:hypothetical protein
LSPRETSDEFSSSFATILRLIDPVLGQPSPSDDSPTYNHFDAIPRASDLSSSSAPQSCVPSPLTLKSRSKGNARLSKTLFLGDLSEESDPNSLWGWQLHYTSHLDESAVVPSSSRTETQLPSSSMQFSLPEAFTSFKF